MKLKAESNNVIERGQYRKNSCITCKLLQKGCEVSMTIQQFATNQKQSLAMSTDNTSRIIDHRVHWQLTQNYYSLAAREQNNILYFNTENKCNTYPSCTHQMYLMTPYMTCSIELSTTDSVANITAWLMPIASLKMPMLTGVRWFYNAIGTCQYENNAFYFDAMH